MFFPSFFEVDAPTLAPKEYADYERARKYAVLLSNLIDEKSNDEQKKFLAAAIKQSNALEDIAYDAYHVARSQAHGR